MKPKLTQRNCSVISKFLTKTNYYWSIFFKTYIPLFILQLLIRLVAIVFPDFQFMWLADETRKNLPLELDFLHEGKNCETVAKMLKNFSFLKVSGKILVCKGSCSRQWLTWVDNIWIATPRISQMQSKYGIAFKSYIHICVLDKALLCYVFISYKMYIWNYCRIEQVMNVRTSSVYLHIEIQSFSIARIWMNSNILHVKFFSYCIVGTEDILEVKYYILSTVF